MHYLVTCCRADAIHVCGKGAKCKKQCSYLLGIKPQASVSVEMYFHLPVPSKTGVLRERITFPRLEKVIQSAQIQAQQIPLDIHEATGDISPLLWTSQRFCHEFRLKQMVFWAQMWHFSCTHCPRLISREKKRRKAWRATKNKCPLCITWSEILYFTIFFVVIT